MSELPGPSVVGLKGSDTTPSLLYNNLTSIDGWVAFVHKNDAVVVDISRPDAPVISHPLQGVEGKAKLAVYQVKAVEVADVPILLCATQTGLVIYDLAKAKVITQLDASDAKDIFMSRGMCSIPQGNGTTLLLGHSNGDISVLNFEGAECSVIKTLSKHEDNVSDVACGTTDAGSTVVASADISGELILWSENFDLVAQASFSGDTATSLHVFGSFVAASFGSGLIRLYNAHDCSVAIEIAAHARWINAMTYSPSHDLLASVSEDMLLCLWQMPSKSNGGKVTLHSYKLLKDCLLTGVRFVNSQLVVTAYDWDRLYLFDLGK
ncbi:Katanin p80 WD40 repeat-containing subunit B1 [Diplonema papillatum]|nr:Katanin p80 WD40 repeat-containing subunit B1 [Diplonema papillatum]